MKSFEVMILASQILGLGTIYSRKHYDELKRNNFKFVRHAYNQLPEDKQNILQEALKCLGVKLEEFVYDTTELDIKIAGGKSIELVGELEDKYQQIKRMLETNEIPANTRQVML